MKPSVIIALLVGGVVGFAVGSMFRSPSSAPVAVAGAPTAPGAAPRAAPAADTTVYKVTLDDAPVQGPSSALITLVEFSDYQCPFCSRANGTVEQLEKDYAGKIRVAMKQTPLSFHPHAKPAASAALAAGEQGKYWEMHSKLFGNQNALEDQQIEGYARDLGLNMEKYKSDLASSKVDEHLKRDQAQATSLGVTGTPAFFINGRKITGAQPIENFKKIIDEEISKAQAMVSSGTPAEQVYAKIIEKGATAPAAAPGNPAPAPTAIRKVDVPQDSPAKGDRSAKVTIVEWSDFQCPFCGRVVPTLKQIEDAYGKNVRVVFRNQPLPMHSNAKIAAEAGLAANEQGKFWQMHDKMFANQQKLDRTSLEGFASELGMDVGKFKAALDSGKFTKRVEEDSAAGAAAGANGTPTFYIDGRELVGAQPFESFKAVIDDEIKKTDALLAKGIKPDDVYAEKQKSAGQAAPAAAQAAPEAKVINMAELSLGQAPTMGPKNATVTLVEFSDFQCPFCSRVVPTLKQLEKEYEGKVKFVFKNQPLPFHQNARPAANAAMAANEQGKFWEMHDKLFENQQKLDRASLEQYANDLHLDMGKFRAALDSNKFDAQISADSAEGTKVGAGGTPTFFINGHQIVGAVGIEQFKAVIDDELKKKK
jgi:protein-disulfide isomerase